MEFRMALEQQLQAKDPITRMTAIDNRIKKVMSLVRTMDEGKIVAEILSIKNISEKHGYWERTRQSASWKKLIKMCKERVRGIQ